jgi:demethylmenaquinone methyltransferase/2-methoxy-6-polyprenyl-1,4-benzoquinol methylase
MQRVTRSKLEARRLYDGLGRWYDLLEGRWERSVVGEALSVMAPQSGEHVLEVGPGTGWALVRLAEAVGPTGRIFAIDLSPSMLEVARDRVARAGLGARIELRLGDAARLPYSDSSFDSVFMSFVLELFDTPEIAVVLSEVRRTLKPGARLVATALSNKRDSLSRRFYEWGHERFPRLLDCRPIDLEGSIRASGLGVEGAQLDSIEGLPVEIVLARRSL